MAKATHSSSTLLHTPGTQPAEAGEAIMLLHRAFPGSWVLQAGPPADTETGQGGFESSLPPLTLSRMRLKRRSFMTKSIRREPKHHSAHKHHAAPANSSTAAIPRGLVRCEVCHEYRGAVRNDDFRPPARGRRPSSLCSAFATEFLASKCGNGAHPQAHLQLLERGKRRIDPLPLVQCPSTLRPVPGRATIAHCLIRDNRQPPLNNQPKRR